MAECVYILHLGVADDGRLNSPFWEPILEWLVARVNRIVFESSVGGEEMIRNACGIGAKVDALPSPAPEMEISSFSLQGSGSTLKSGLKSVHYSADGAIEFIFFFVNEKEIASLHIEDENFLLLRLTEMEATGLSESIGDLSSNVEYVRSHPDEIPDILGKEKLNWKPLGFNG